MKERTDFRKKNIRDKFLVMLPLSLFDSFLFYHIFYCFSIASNNGAYSASFSAEHIHQNCTFTSESDKGTVTLPSGTVLRLFAIFVINEGKSLALTISRRAESSLCSKNTASGIFSLHTEYQKPILLYMRIFSPARSFSCSVFRFASR